MSESTLFAGRPPLADWRGWKKFIARLRRRVVLRLQAMQLSPERREIYDWLSTFGKAETGLPIERPLVHALSRAGAGELARSGEGVAADDLPGAVAPLVPLTDDLPATEGVWLSKLAGMARLVANGPDVPPRHAAAAAGSERPSRVLYAVHMRHPYFTSGYVSRTRFMTRCLTEAGCAVEAATRLGFPAQLGVATDAPAPAREELDGIPYHGLDDPGGGWNRRAMDDYIDAYARRLEALAAETGAEVLHGASNYLNGLAAIIAARRAGLPAIYEVRGRWEMTRLQKDPDYRSTLSYDLDRRLEMAAAREADAVITLSEQLKNYLVTEGADPEKIFVAANGIDPGKAPAPTPLDFSGGKVRMGYIGSLVDYEGLETAIGATAALRDEGRDATFTIIGDGPARAGLEGHARRLHCTEAVRFLGRMPFEETLRHYPDIDIVLIPRKQAAVTAIVPPMKIVEAQAAGKLVIASDLPVLREEVEDGETGFVARPGDPADFAAKIRAAVEAPALAQEIANAGRERALRSRTPAAIGAVARAAYGYAKAAIEARG